MKVSVVAKTVGVKPELVDKPIIDLIAFCARVSNPSNQINTATADRLIRYLIKHKHWSPFDMANIVIEVETTRDIARQLLRHSSMKFQEFSQRYADPTKDLQFVYREARLQDEKNRQNSIETDDQSLQVEWHQQQEKVALAALEAYQWATGKGIAKEVARAVLPEGMMESRLYVNATIRSFIHYLEVRLDGTTQKEHRELAMAIAEAIADSFDYTSTITKEQ